MRTLSIWMVLPFLALLACENKPEGTSPPAGPPAAEQPAAPAAPPAPAPAPQVAAAEVPTAADFEQQALDEITPQNAEDELAKLEKDIGE